MKNLNAVKRLGANKNSGAEKMSIRKLFAPALLAIALAPLAITAQAHNHSDDEARGPDRERMEERRQEVYQRAELSEEKQAELNAAYAEHRDAMNALREEHKERVTEILSEEEQEALRTAMQEIHDEYRGQHGKRGRHDNSDDSADSE